MTFHPKTYFFNAGQGKCGFRFVGTDSLSGGDTYIFGAPAYSQFAIVHNVDTRTIAMKAQSQDVSMAQVFLPLNKVMLVGQVP